MSDEEPARPPPKVNRRDLVDRLLRVQARHARAETQRKKADVAASKAETLRREAELAAAEAREEELAILAGALMLERE